MMNVHRTTLMLIIEQDMTKFTPAGHNTNSLTETSVCSVICYQLRYPTFFRNCDLLVLNKSHGKTTTTIIPVRNNSFTDCDTEGLIMKAN